MLGGHAARTTDSCEGIPFYCRAQVVQVHDLSDTIGSSALRPACSTKRLHQPDPSFWRNAAQYSQNMCISFRQAVHRKV